jgi:hypothetical protein
MAYRRSIDFLPNVFRTEVNDKFLHATVDQLISEPELRRLDGYIGRKFSPVAGPNDSFVNEFTTLRQNYQLEPNTVYTNNQNKVEFSQSYIDLLRRIDALGGFTNNHSRLFSDITYNYNGFVDYDKFLNYSSYYWLPNGPDEVPVFATEIPLQREYKVIPPALYQVLNGELDREKFDTISFDTSENLFVRVREDGIKFDVTGTKINPTIRLARGGTYTFKLDQIGHGFYIQTTPGTTEQLSWQKNLNTRDVYGVENNGEDVGTITFRVPEVGAQDFFNRMPVFGEAHLLAHSTRRNRDLRYSDLHYKKLEDIVSFYGGIDGTIAIENKTLVFPIDPASGKNPQPWRPFTDYKEGDLIQYIDSVYRVLEDYTSGATFTTSKIELYDLQESWYNPDPFDSIDRPYDTNSFDIGESVNYEQRRGIFVVTINDDGYVVLRQGAIVPRNKKLQILEGSTYGNKAVYRNSNDDILLFPLITAPLNTLYYADSLDTNIGGIIELVEQNNNLKIDVPTSILNHTIYESPNGVEFTNGLKIRFLDDVVPSTYANKTYYVEGVGTGIDLIDASDLIAGETWLDLVEFEFDVTGFDDEPYSASLNQPIAPDYYVINRKGLEQSAWVRHNRWFHKDVIELTAKYNNYIPSVDATARAQRPILEFDPNLQLYNFGQIAKKAIDVIDTSTLDALSIIEGKAVSSSESNIIRFTGSAELVEAFVWEKESSGYVLIKETINADGIVTVQMKLTGQAGYFVDDIPLTPGLRIVFTADTDPDVRNKIYQVEWIRPQSDTENRVWSFVADGSSSGFDLNYDVTDTLRLRVFVNGIDANEADYFWSYISATQTINFEPTTIPPEGSNITVSIKFDNQLHLVLTNDSEVLEGDCVYIKRGLVNQGKMFYYTNGDWKETQQKTKINQAPLFDLYNDKQVSYSDEAVYTSTSFSGNKLFGYEVGSGNVDPVLGLRLKYRNINNIGDILFGDFITKGSISYRQGQKSISQNLKGAKVRENKKDKTFSFRNQWTKITQKSRQPQLQTFYATEYQKNLFRLKVIPDGIKEIKLANIIVYVNNIFIYTNNYDLQIEDNIAYLYFNKDVNAGDKIDVKIYSSINNDQSQYETPLNFTNNPFNREITEITLGQFRNHIIKTIEDIPQLSNEPLSKNNLRDTPNVKAYQGNILQHSGSNHLANFFLNDSNANFVNAVINAQREYVRFKNRILQLAAELIVANEPPNNSLDRVMTEMVANKNKNFAYFTSDVLPFGNDYKRLTYKIVDDRLTTYDLSETFNLIKPSHKAVLLYLNNVQLVVNKDYVFSEDRPVVELNLDNVTIKQNDILEIREYSSIDGSYVPPTPTKLGLYPLFVPSIVKDGYGENTRSMIRGHDGSLTAMFNDSRDAVLLEYETRIYNNIKTTYDPKKFDIYEYIPSAFRKTDYDLNEFNSILSSHFSSWSGSNAIAVSDFRQFVANDDFTYNYGRFTNKLDGKLMPASAWRGLYRYYYDTDAPHLRPWEMLGFAEQPSWWEEAYGPAPYTSGNTLLWDDLEAGKILSGDRQGVDRKFARPGLKNIIPVDGEGELLSPFACLAKDVNELDVSGFYKFGDGGPVESTWRQSSEYPFVVQLALAIMKPAEYFGYIDTNNQIISLVDEQLIFEQNGVREYSNQLVQNELDSNGNIYRANSYITWISEYCKNLGLDITKHLGNKFRNLESRLGYKVAGYTDKKYLRVITDQYTPASNNPGIIIPDDDFDIVLNKSAPLANLTYSGVIVTKTVDGYSVSGYDDNKPYFTIEASKQNDNRSFIKVGKLAAIKYYEGTGEFFRVPYGTEFFGTDQLSDFLLSYGRYLTRQGFQFKDKLDQDASWYLDWDLAVREFLFYVQQGWDFDVAISLSPVGNKINYRSNFGAVDALSNRPLNTRILDEDFAIVRASEYSVYRNGRDFNAKIDTARGIYLLDLDVVEYEHVLIFNNITRFNDIIYDPIIGDRQHRLRIQGFKTGDWDGTYSAAGFIINEDNVSDWRPGVNYNKGDIVIFKGEYFTAGDKIPASAEFEFSNWIKTEYNLIKKGLLPNLANRSSLPKSYYDTNEVNLEQDSQKLAKNLVGFESRSYMEDLGISDTSQFKFYQGMISQKGTNSSLDKLLKAKVDNFGGFANVYEEWAIRVGKYGATDSTRNLQIQLDEAWATKDPLVVELLNDNDPVPAGHKGLKQKEIYIKHVPYDKNFLGTRKNKYTPEDLYTAGYLQLSDVDYASPTRDELNSYVTGNDIGQGDLVWIAADRNNQWNVYRINETDIKLESLNIISNGNATIRCVNNHNFVKNDLIFIKSDNTDPNVFGFFSVINIIDARTFVVSTGYGSLQINPFSGFVYKLTSLRFNSSSEVAEREPTKGWKVGDKLFIDNSSNGWEIYENANAYSTGPAYRASLLQSADKLGYSIATDNENSFMIAGRPGNDNNHGSIVIFTITNAGTLQENSILTLNSDNVSDLGFSVSVSSDGTFIAGAPTSDNIGFVSVFYSDRDAGSYRMQQVIASETIDAGGEFGYSVKVSQDGNFLVVGQPGVDEGYVYLYQKSFVNRAETVELKFTGDGSSAVFPLLGDASNPEEDSVIVIKDGTALTLNTDYTIATTAITLTAVPAEGSQFTVIIERGDPEQTIITDGSTISYRLEGDNANPSSIYALYVELNGVVQVPFRDYTLQESAGSYYLTFTTLPANNLEVYVNQRTHFELVSSFTSVDASFGDRFGHSLSLTDFGRQIIVGAPATLNLLEDSSLLESGAVYVFDRTAENFYADGITVNFTPDATIEGDPHVFVDNKKVLKGADKDYLVASNTVTFNVAPASGSIVRVDTNNIIQASKVNSTNAGDTLIEYSRFGESVAICPLNCSIYVGAPGHSTNDKINSGKVYRFINQGRYYGTIKGLVVNPEITTDSVIAINDFLINLSLGSDLDGVVNAINSANIPGITAFNDNDYLLIESNSLISGEKILLTSLLGQPLVELGLEVYAFQQTIDSPDDDHYVEFGRSIAVNNDADLIAVGSSKGSIRLDTLIDGNQTYFDARSTAFNDVKKQSGAVWLYQYLPVANSSVDKPGQFIAAQRLVNRLVDRFDEFGSSIAINKTNIYVSAPGDDTKIDNSTFNNSGVVYTFENKTNKKIWKSIRSEKLKVDIKLINRVFLYNKEKNQIVTDLDFIDPVKGKISGLAAQEITYQTPFDPAIYNINSSGRVWGKEHLGQVWWDISQTRWIDYEQGNIDDRGINWNTAFPGSTIICYEWIESSVPPSQYIDEKDSTSFARSNAHNLLADIDPNTGVITNKYYYWVAGKRSISANTNRRFSTVDLENIIANPRSTGIPFIAFVSTHAVALYNCSQFLTDKNIILNVEYDAKFNENSIHTEFQLLSENDANSLPNEFIVKKLIDSLAGSDTEGNLVPDINLTEGEKHGIDFRPRQTMFRDRITALKSAVNYINLVLARIPARDNKDTTNLLAFEEIPNENAGVYNEVVNDKVELGYLNIDLLEPNYKVLVKTDDEVDNRWAIYRKSNGVWVLDRVQTFDNNRYIEIIDWVKPGVDDPIVTTYTVNFSYLLSSLTPSEGDTVKIKDSGNGRYTILQYKNNSYEIIKQQASTFKIIDAIWDESIFVQGFSRETFDIQTYDDWPTTEIQKILRAVYEDIFSENEKIEKNKWFLLMMQHLLAEQKYVDYVFKTSFIKVEHRNQQAISQIASLQKDRQESLQKYIEEIKPYHTKIREFVTSHEGFDSQYTAITDFDVPAYYDETTGKYRSPTGLDEIDNAILDRPEYQAWLRNYGLELQSVIIYKTSSNFSVAPKLNVISDSGKNAKLESTVVNGEITNVKVIDSGSGYLTTPTIEVGVTGDTTAKLIAIMGNSKIRQIKDTIKFDRIPNNGGFIVQFREENQTIIGDGSTTAFEITNQILNYAPELFIYTVDETKLKPYIDYDIDVDNNTVIFTDAPLAGQILLVLGKTVDIRNQRKSRYSLFAGVIDELLDVISDGNWIVPVVEWQTNTIYTANEKVVYQDKVYRVVATGNSGSTFDTANYLEDVLIYPVEGISNYRIFDDTSGRIQIQYKKTPGGLITESLQTAVRNLGATVGVDELDLRGTFVFEDGNMSLYTHTILDWKANTRYDQGDLINYEKKIYTLKESVPQLVTDDEFDISELRPYGADEFNNHINRTWAYYHPEAGLPGRDLGQLINGLEYPGVKVQGASFRAESGFDVGNYDIAGLDQFIIGEEGTKVLDPSILDQTLYSNFLDTSLGTRPEDIITHGGSFVDIYSSHAPEEAIPGRVYDTLDIRVFTTPASDILQEGLGLYITTSVSEYNESNIYSFLPTLTRGDHLIVFSKNYGRLDKTVDYTVDYKNKKITVIRELIESDIVFIYAFNGGGEGLIYDQEIICQQDVKSYILQIEDDLIKQSFVTLNGEKITDYVIDFFEEGLSHITVGNTITLTSNDVLHVHLFSIESDQQQHINVATERFVVTGNTYPEDYTFNLSNEIGYSYPNAEKIIVEVNNVRLRPPNQRYYIGDGTTIEFAIPFTRDIDFNGVTEATVKVAFNNTKLYPSIDFNLNVIDGSTIPTITLLTLVPSEDDVITISLLNNAEYQLIDDNTILISNTINLSDNVNDIVRITTFTNDEKLNIRTTIYEGETEQTVSTSIEFDEVGFDTVGYDVNSANILNTKIFTLESPVRNVNYLWVTFDDDGVGGGKFLLPNIDYELIENGTKIKVVDSITFYDNSLLVITQFADNVQAPAIAFRAFKDLNDNWNYYRIGSSASTELVQPLEITNKEIFVKDASVLPEPNTVKAIPGVIMVGGERILYYGRDLVNNRLYQLRRGIDGTGAIDFIPRNTIIQDASLKQALPDAHNKIWYDLGETTASNGLGLQYSNSQQAQFLLKDPALPISKVFDSKFFINGYVINGYVFGNLY